MKKLSIMVALGLTMSMMFGMTAFAAESVSTGTAEVDGVKVEVPEVTQEEIKGDSAVKEIVAVKEAPAAKKTNDVGVSEAGDTSEITGATTLYLPPSLTVEAKVDSTVVTATEKASLEAVNKETTASTVVLVDGVAQAVVVETKPLATDKAAKTIKSATTSVAGMVSKILAEADADTDTDLSVIKVDKVEAIGATDVDLPDAIKNNIPEGGSIDVTINFENLKVDSGKTYFLLHLNGDKWEPLQISGIEDGKVTARFTSFSPVVLNEVVLVAADDTKDEDDDDDDDVNTVATAVTAANTATATSPKTGETFPVAGIVALVAAAGAAVATRKVRYNK